MKIQVGDLAIEYEIDGEEGKPVLMLHHSLATSLDMWEDLNLALVQHYRVLRFDARGHGKTTAPEGDYAMPQLAGDAIGLMNALGIQKATHVGLSMGGMIGQYLGITAADRVDALVLLSTTSQMPPEAAPIWEERIAQVKAQGMAPLVEPTMQRWFTPDFLASGDSVLEEIRREIAATPVNGFCGWAAAISDLNLTAHLPGIKAPTLIMVGADDAGTPPAMSQVIAAQIAGSRLEIVENASHMLPLQQPDRFLETLIDFLEDQGEATAV